MNEDIELEIYAEYKRKAFKLLDECINRAMDIQRNSSLEYKIGADYFKRRDLEIKALKLAMDLINSMIRNVDNVGQMDKQLERINRVLKQQGLM